MKMTILKTLSMQKLKRQDHQDKTIKLDFNLQKMIRGTTYLKNKHFRKPIVLNDP